MATIEDARLLAELNAVVQRLHYDALPEHYTPVDVDSATSFFENELESPQTHVLFAEVGTLGVVGYALTKETQRPATPFAHSRSFLELDQLAVLSSHQRKGTGRRLMEEVLDLARSLGLERVELTVMSFNEAAFKAHERVGFETVGVRMATAVHRNGSHGAGGRKTL